MNAYDLLRQAVDTATPKLAAMSDEESLRARHVGAWTPRQILGHLIDSACNNHARFVKAQFNDELVFPGYDQDAWVAVQRYDDSPWADLVTLWRTYNLHLVRVIAAMPAEALTRRRTHHNLDQIAWRAVPTSEPVTLEYFVRDYVGHLENHLTQVLPDYAPISFEMPSHAAGSK